MKGSARSIPRSLLAFAIVFAFAIGISGALPPSAASAAPAHEQTDAPITWSVRPADESGRDGRSWVELTLDPGQTATERLEISNLSDVPATFRLSAADAYLTDKGRFNMLPSSQPSKDGGTWISVQEEVHLEAGEKKVISFQISVPADASPGDHPAGIAASIVSLGAAGDGSRVSVESRVGFRVMTRVTGEVRVGVDAVEIATSYRYSWNPFQPGSMTIRVKAVNTGNVAVGVGTEYHGPGASNRSAAPEGEDETNLFPGDTRTIVYQVDDVWPLGFVQGRLLLHPHAGDADAAAPDSAPVTFSAWVLPLPQLALVIGMSLIVLALVAGRRRSRARVQRLVDEARESGRRESLERDALASSARS